jgi:hypothetical protein
MNESKAKQLSTWIAAAAAASEQGIDKHIDFEKEINRILETERLYTEFLPISYGPAVKSKKTIKARKKNKAAKQSRKKNRK